LAGGGAERVMTTLLCHSVAWRDKYEISLVLLDDEYAAYAVPDWIKIHRLDCRNSLLRSIWRLRGLVKSMRPHITISFLTRANVANWGSRIGKSRPWVISERVNANAHLRTDVAGYVGRWLVRLCYPRATHVIAVSQGVADDLSDTFSVPRDCISVIANPVDTAAIQHQSLGKYPISLDEPYIAAIGRLVENKNFALLIDAFATSSVAGKLLIIGDGPLRPALEERIAVYGLQDRVILTGFLDNPFPLLANAQIFVLPSNAEGFPNGLVEAMSTATAVISTNCRSGPSEILARTAKMKITGMTLADFGILVPCNDVDAMAQSLRYLQNDEARKAYAKLAVARTKDYTAEKAAQRYWDVIESALHAA
jgi:glycosyltransferase involved in cell wall biosynthesis